MNKENVITLDNPVKRGEQVIEQVTLMKPNAGTLRGVSLAAVANSEVDALIKVLPRMTAPMLTEQEVAALELPEKAGAKQEPAAEKISDKEEDAVVGLMSLGYTRAESVRAVKRAEEAGAKSMEEIIMTALRSM